jgi:hypothetical protein
MLVVVFWLTASYLFRRQPTPQTPSIVAIREVRDLV